MIATATTCTILNHTDGSVCGREAVLSHPSVPVAPCAQHERAYRRHLSRKGLLPRAWAFRPPVAW